MKAIRMALVSFLGLLVASTLAFAHHSFGAQYDESVSVAMTGTITKVIIDIPAEHADWKIFIDRHEVGGALGALRRVTGRDVIHIKWSEVCTGRGRPPVGPVPVKLPDPV